MSSIGKLITIKPTDFTRLGTNVAYVGAGLILGALITHTVYELATTFFKTQNETVKNVLAVGSILAGVAVTFVCAPQVSLFALSAAKILEVTVLTAVVEGVVHLAGPKPKSTLWITIAALPILGIGGGLLGKYAILTAGAVGSVYASKFI
jgi:hypothetical protein